jgi:hypothetical protein
MEDHSFDVRVVKLTVACLFCSPLCKTLWASMAAYRDSVTFFAFFIILYQLLSLEQ